MSGVWWSQQRRSAGAKRLRRRCTDRLEDAAAWVLTALGMFVLLLRARSWATISVMSPHPGTKAAPRSAPDPLIAGAVAGLQGSLAAPSSATPLVCEGREAVGPHGLSTRGAHSAQDSPTGSKRPGRQCAAPSRPALLTAATVPR